MKRFGSLLLAALLWLALLIPDNAAAAEKRVALVIGNSAYRNAPVLANPRNDATDIAAMLERLGFTVSTLFDADRDAMEEAVERFSETVENADVALLYYAGHAMQHEGVNYLMPVDASLQSAAGLRRMTRLNDLLADMRKAKALRMVVLDACRDNPMAERLQATTVATRSAGLAKLSTRSLAKLKQSEVSTQQGGDMIVYAAEAGRTAADGTGRNSPFTAAFLRHADREGQEIVQLMRRVTTDVQEATRGEQRPELSLSVPFEFYFKQGSAPPQASVRQLLPQAKPHEASAIERAVELIVERATPEQREQTRREVMAILADLATRSGLRSDQIAEELAKAHDKVIKLRADIEAFRQITENEPEVAGFIEIAAAALASGRRPDRKAADEALAAAQVRYDTAIQRRTQALDTARTRRAELSEKRGDIAMTEYRFRDAVELFRAAATDVPERNDNKAIRAGLFTKAGTALYLDGLNFYRNNALREAIVLLEEKALPLVEAQDATTDEEKELRARNNAIVLSWLGQAQETLGNRVQGRDGLVQVVEARRTYTRAANLLEGYTGYDSVSVLIDILDNRASRDTRFGSRVSAERGQQYFESAVSVHRVILGLMDRHPKLAADRARSSNNLAFTLFEQAKRLDTEPALKALDEATTLFRAARDDFNKGTDEERKIISRTNVAEVLSFRARRSEGEARQRDAAEASRIFDQLMTEIDPNAQPRLYLNMAFRALVHRRFVVTSTIRPGDPRGFEMLKEIFALQQSLFTYLSEETAPHEWAVAVAELGHTLVAGIPYTERENKQELAEQSRRAFNIARERFVRSINEFEIKRIEESEATRLRLVPRR